MNLTQRNLLKSLKKIAGQKFTWFTLSMAFLTFTAFTTRPDAQPSIDEEITVIEEEMTPSESVASEADHTPQTTEDYTLPTVERIAMRPHTEEDDKRFTKKSFASKTKKKAAALVDYAQSLLGRPYNYGGTSPAGFDCSGYIYHVFSKFDFDMERSSRTQSTQGTEIAVDEVVPGDLLFFTGTNPSIREVGHVGIVISEPGEPVTFIHSSSNGGVKISDLEGYYTTRFMFAKTINE